MMNTYFNWFKKVINVLIEIFFVCAIVASLLVFTSAFAGTTRVVSIFAIFVAFGLVVYFLKDIIKRILSSVISYLSNLDEKKMLLIIVLTMIGLKIIYSIFFYFDTTIDGDIALYSQIGDELVNNGTIASDTIAHLLGIGVHLAIFKLLHLPFHIGMFILILAGTVINFISFKKIIGKEKSFIAVMLYVLMPSTCLLSFCITHEILVYFYLSLFLYMFNSLIAESNKTKTIIYLLLTIISTVLVCFVNPGGYIVYVIMFLSIVLSNLKINKKGLIVLALVISLCSNLLISNKIDSSSGNSTSLNTYVILIHGTNPESLGEQIDGYPLHTIRQYLRNHNMELTDDNYLIGAKGVFADQCLYLLSHPMNLLKLVCNKIYKLWSGNHYSIEMANHFGSVDSIMFYMMLSISTLIYLFVLSIGYIYRKYSNDSMTISNYKLALLGIIAVTMVSIVTNKYSLQVTLFIYLISFYKIDIDENK